MRRPYTVPGSIEGVKQDIIFAQERVDYLAKRLSDLDRDLIKYYDRDNPPSAGMLNAKADLQRQEKSALLKLKHALKRQGDHAGYKSNPSGNLFENSEQAWNAVALFEKSFKLYPPYFKAFVSTLGGDNNASVIITISLDEKDSWNNGILENSRYSKFHLMSNGYFEQIAGYGVADFRKIRISSAENAVSKLEKWLEKSRVDGAPKTFGIFKWREDGKYQQRDALKVFKTESGADKFAKKMYGSGNRDNLVARQMDYFPNPVPLAKGTKSNRSGVRIVHNKLLGGWFIVRGPHQTPLGGRFDSKLEAQAHLDRQQFDRDSLLMENPISGDASGAAKYVRGLRNEKKRVFADAVYRAKLRDGDVDSIPTRLSATEAKSIVLKIDRLMRKGNPTMKSKSAYGRAEIVKQAQLLSDRLGKSLKIKGDGRRVQILKSSGAALSPLLSPDSLRIWLHGAISATV